MRYNRPILSMGPLGISNGAVVKLLLGAIMGLALTTTLVGAVDRAREADTAEQAARYLRAARVRPLPPPRHPAD